MRYVLSTLALFVLAGGGCAIHPAPAGHDGTPASRAAGASSDVGTLGFEPARPRAGDRINATYRARGTLVREPELRLRARLRTPDHDSYNAGLGSRTVAVLHRQPDGSYKGSFTLPGEVVYAAFAVEDVAAAAPDSREGRFWELIVHGGDGRPLLSALEQRSNDHMGRDELVVLETARTMAILYPHTPRAWTMLRAAEGWVLGDEGADDRTAVHQQRMRDFDRDLAAQAGLTADQVGFVYWYGLILRDSTIAGRWRERLLEEHPGHFFAVQERVMELRREHTGDPGAMLTQLDRLWSLADDREGRERIIGPAMTAARQTEDRHAILRWANRWRDLGPGSRIRVATALASHASTRDEGIRRLQAAIAEVERATDAERSLGATMAEHHDAAVRRAAALRTSLGTALVAAGQTSAGIAALERAAAVDWNVTRFRTLAGALQDAGDRDRAARAYAAVAVDPSTPTAIADSLRLEVGFSLEAWEEAMASARIEMLDRTLAAARAEPVAPAAVTLRAGPRASLVELLGDRATVVVFWSRYCGPSVQAMPRIADLAARLAHAQVPLIAVTRDSPTDAEPYLAEGGWDIQVAYDTAGEAARALNSWGTPQYFVLDGTGQLRYAFSSLDDLPRQIAALTERHVEAP